MCARTKTDPQIRSQTYVGKLVHILTCIIALVLEKCLIYMLRLNSCSATCQSLEDFNMLDANLFLTVKP